MPRKQRVVTTPSPPTSDEDEDMDFGSTSQQQQQQPTRNNDGLSGFKSITEIIAEADNNIPSEQIDKDIDSFSSYSDISDWRGIPKFFPSLSSLSRRASTYENWENRFKVVDYLVSCSGALKDSVSDYVADYFEKNESGEDHSVDVELVHAVSMFVILTQRLTVQLQLYVSKSIASANQQAKRGTGRGGRQVDLDDDIVKWKDIQRHRMINCLLELLELRVDTVAGTKKKAIQYVFAPDVMEKDFLLRFLDTVVQLLEDPENMARSSQQWISHYFRILKVLSADYGMTKDVANCLFTALSHSYLEAANTFPFIEPLVTLMKENGEGSGRIYQPLRNVLQLVICRVGNLYAGERAEKPPPKAFCMMVQSLAINVHDLMLQDITHVYRLLQNQHVNVRMSTLHALADMFSSSYLSQSLCDTFASRRLKREGIFKRLLAHTNDEATNVRSKAVSLLRNIMENRRIPEEFESCGLLSIVGSRLNDKSVQVRKSAIQFLTTFLDNNRHGHDFNREMHQLKLNAKCSELRNAEEPQSKAIQGAENAFRQNLFTLTAGVRVEVYDIFRRRYRVEPERSITDILTGLFSPGSGNRLVRYYVAQENFPFRDRIPSLRERRSDDMEDDDDDTVSLEDDDMTSLVSEVVKWVVAQAEEDYVTFKVQLTQMDDDQLLENEQEARDRNNQIMQLRAQVQQLINKMSIEQELSRCVTIALRCVLNGETAEIKEGIRFLTRCKLFEITGADDAIRSMCSLVWRPSADILNELIEAAEDMFISRLDGNEKASERDSSTVENLMKAMNGVTEKDRPSVEEVIYLLAATELVHVDSDKNKVPRKRRPIEANVINKLWMIALDMSHGINSRKIDALRILYPISRSERGIAEARSRLRVVQKKLMDPELAVDALRIISILGTPTKLENEQDAYSRPLFKIHQDDSLWKSIEKLFFYEIMKADDNPDRDWFGVIRLTITTILSLSMDVNVMLPKLASHFVYRTKRISDFFLFYCDQVDDATDDTRKKMAQRRREYWALTYCRVMEKLMAFIGEVAVQLNAYIQVTIPKLHTRYVSKMVDAEKNDANIREEPVRFLSDLEKSVAQRKTIFTVPQDTTPGATSNDLHHLVSVMCDKRLFVPNKLMGRLLPIVVYGMRCKIMPTRIRHAATVAYGKMMPLSAEISAFAAPSFFSAMTKSSSILLRCNLVAACCDFAFAQPTLFELFAQSLFRMSQDESPLARESTILVLSHLMSNDMIQTRGVLSEAARCICDPTRAVRDVAQSFFKELNSRTDTIIQLLPEFLYHLSNGNERMSFKSYKTVFEFLIQLLKDKPKASADSMIDRVCIKFSNTDMNDSETPKYLLVALAKFVQNDGGLHRLQDNWRHWSKFMCHPSVAKEYRMMVEHMHSTSKNDEFKSQCVELIDNINKIESEGLRKEDVAIGSSITKNKGRAKKNPTTMSGSSRTTSRAANSRRRAPPPAQSDEDDSDSDDAPAAPRSAARRKAKKSAVADDDSDSDEFMLDD